MVLGDGSNLGRCPRIAIHATCDVVLVQYEYESVQVLHMYCTIPHESTIMRETTHDHKGVEECATRLQPRPHTVQYL